MSLQGLGGGNDGGVKAVKRAFFVKEKAKEVKVDPSELCAIKWHLCALSAQELREPVGVVAAMPVAEALSPWVLRVC